MRIKGANMLLNFQIGDFSLCKFFFFTWAPSQPTHENEGLPWRPKTMSLKCISGWEVIRTACIWRAQVPSCLGASVGSDWTERTRNILCPHQTTNQSRCSWPPCLSNMSSLHQCLLLEIELNVSNSQRNLWVIAQKTCFVSLTFEKQNLVSLDGMKFPPGVLEILRLIGTTSSPAFSERSSGAMWYYTLLKIWWSITNQGFVGEEMDFKCDSWLYRKPVQSSKYKNTSFFVVWLPKNKCASREYGSFACGNVLLAFEESKMHQKWGAFQIMSYEPTGMATRLRWQKVRCFFIFCMCSPSNDCLKSQKCSWWNYGRLIQEIISINFLQKDWWTKCWMRAGRTISYFNPNRDLWTMFLTNWEWGGVGSQAPEHDGKLKKDFPSSLCIKW